MKIKIAKKKGKNAFVLLLVMVLAACSITILIGVMHRTSTVALLNQRSNQVTTLNNAAEAAVEKAYAKMAWDFHYNISSVASNLNSYITNPPVASDNAYWGNIQFSDGQGNIGQTYVQYITNYTGPMPTQYTNQFATTSPVYRILSNARMPSSLVPGVVGTAQEDILLALVPITTYAIFYNGPLEFSDCATMLVNGRVHSNTYICVGAGSGASLTFNNMVTTCGTITAPQRGGVDYWTLTDPTTWATTFNGSYTTNVSTINLSMVMTNAHEIIDVPPSRTTEAVMSPVGVTRLYNQAQVVIMVTNTPGTNNPTVVVTLQTPYNGQLPGADASPQIYTLTNVTQTYLNTNVVLKGVGSFLSLTNQFYDQRQLETNFITQVDVGQYGTWLNTGSAPTNKFTSGAYPTILYVADQRNIGSATRQSAVRLMNGATLPYNGGFGFTVATDNPLYVEGNYNVKISGSTNSTMGLGSTTNGSSIPAALLCDAITILSTNWSDALSGGTYGNRNNPANMTLNAALVTGAMPSTGTDANTFSGGVQNLTRFLENWGNYTLTLNTSIVNLYNSQIATNQFKMPGTYYNPPTRNWGFDTTYYSPGKTPPGIPCALVPIRFNWQTPPPGVVTSGQP